MSASAAKGGKFLQTIAGVAPEMHGRTIPATPAGLHFTEPAPWGVVGALCAYNHPTLFTCMKAAPALAAGNSVVLKPAEQTPLSPLLIASLAEDLLPPGVLNVVPGGGATSRLLIHADLREAVLQRVVEQTERIRIGMPDDPSSQMGCMVSHGHRDRILGFVDAGKADGGRLLTGGTPPADPALAAGAFIRPAIFDDVAHGATVAREEIFGPVLAVTTFSDAAEAVAMANDTPYGLTATILSYTRTKAISVAISPALPA